jgi:hypothetical protein
MLGYFILETVHEINPFEKKLRIIGSDLLHLRLNRMMSKVPKRLLAWACGLCLPLNAAFGEIDRLPAPLAKVLSVELVRKNLFFFPAIGALTNERPQILKFLQPRAMLRCCHDAPPPSRFVSFICLSSILGASASQDPILQGNDYLIFLAISFPYA